MNFTWTRLDQYLCWRHLVWAFLILLPPYPMLYGMHYWTHWSPNVQLMHQSFSQSLHLVESNNHGGHSSDAAWRSPCRNIAVTYASDWWGWVCSSRNNGASVLEDICVRRILAKTCLVLSGRVVIWMCLYCIDDFTNAQTFLAAKFSFVLEMAENFYPGELPKRGSTSSEFEQHPGWTWKRLLAAVGKPQLGSQWARNDPNNTKVVKVTEKPALRHPTHLSRDSTRKIMSLGDLFLFQVMTTWLDDLLGKAVSSRSSSSIEPVATMDSWLVHKPWPMASILKPTHC